MIPVISFPVAAGLNHQEANAPGKHSRANHRINSKRREAQTGHRDGDHHPAAHGKRGPIAAFPSHLRYHERPGVEPGLQSHEYEYGFQYQFCIPVGCVGLHEASLMLRLVLGEVSPNGRRENGNTQAAPCEPPSAPKRTPLSLGSLITHYRTAHKLPLLYTAHTQSDGTKMIVTFLGTAAANAFPEAFCKCQNCAQARKLGGPSLRKRSSALINNDLLIDLGPDIMSASHLHGCSLDGVRYCLQTHPHADHLDLSHLLSRSPEYGVVGAPVLNVYASRETSERAAETFERDLAGYRFLSPEAEKRLNFKIHQIRPLEPFTVGSYSVMAFPANHAPGMGAMLFSIEAQGRAIFYGTDTATLFEQTWQVFRERKIRFDAVILDHTYGPEQAGGDHLNAHQVIEHAGRMRAEGVLRPDGRVFATHIAHEGNPAHPGLDAFAKQHGYEVAYDGLILTI